MIESNRQLLIRLVNANLKQLIHEIEVGLILIEEIDPDVKEELMELLK